MSENKQVQGCFHCSEPVPSHLKIQATIDGEPKPVCCLGCKAVSEFIHLQGHNRFYDYRGDSKPQRQAEVSEEEWKKFDDDSYLLDSNDHQAKARVRVDGMYCSACSWLLDKHLKSLQGVKDVSMNTMTRQMHIEFDQQKITFSQILTSINRLGYVPIVSQDENNDQALQEKRKFMKRLIVAGIGMMQVMTISVPLYAESSEIDAGTQRFFELISLLVATWVYFYSGTVFVKNALRDLRNRHLGMDVPVALSISLAYFASVWNTLIAESSIIYFDSMIMFVFFLLAGRFVEMNVRHQGMSSTEALSTLIPNQVTRLVRNKPQSVPLTEIKKGDVLLLKSSETVPCDGLISSGKASFNESIITGEARPVAKGPGDQILAGSQLISGEVEFISEAIGDETFLAELGQMLESAQLQRPKTLMLVDKVAAGFVALILLLAVSVAVYYYFHDPQLALPIVLAVLVATCPCALSLATPTVLTAASVKLMKKGVLIQNLDALNLMNKKQVWIFDKTGTLTDNNMRIQSVQNHSSLKDEEILNLIANLERESQHPIATAFNQSYVKALNLENLTEKVGQGLSADWSGQNWKLGSAKFCGQHSNEGLYLTADEKLMTVVQLTSSLRQGAADTLQWLKPHSSQQLILSGDNQSAVKSVAEYLGVTHMHHSQNPEDKINKIKELQCQGLSTVMVGDGVNDAPVLAQSNISISLSQGTHLARMASDFILISQGLNALKNIYQTAQASQKVIRQNISWALIYNLSVTPLAMMGHLKPWMAAIGMSLSSLLVVLNSRRVG